MTLSLDFETRSTVDLTRTGVYVYAESPTTEVLCMAYALGDGPVRLWNRGEPFPAEVVDHVVSGGDLRAHNAQFERVIWRDVLAPRLGLPVPTLEQWHCTAAEAAAMALPRSLKQVAQVLGLKHQKDDAGHRVMLQLCKPRSTEDTDLGPVVTWWEDEDKFETLYAYCKQDVETERAVASKIRRLGPKERQVYLMDQRLNDRGVYVDLPLVHAAEKVVKKGLRQANTDLKAKTGTNLTVSRVEALVTWLQEVEGVDVPNLRKHTVHEWLTEKADLLTPAARAALEIRQEAAKSSTAKLSAMVRCTNTDSRARGLHLYHGASTGRWSGKGIQPQNFPRGEVKGVEEYIPDLLAGGTDFGGASPLTAVSSMLRSMLRAAPGKILRAGDYSQIEARILGWIAEEPYGDLEYERMAAAIYRVPVEEIVEEHAQGKSERRTMGKNTVLGCGFQMGPKTYVKQAWERGFVRLPLDMGKRAVYTYRDLKPGIPAFWSAIEGAAMAAVREPGKITFCGLEDKLRWVVRGQFLWCVLPSGRPLAYALPAIRERQTKWGPKVGLEFKGINGYTKKWETRHAYGGFLTENVVQAMARDLMAEAMLKMEAAGYPPVLTVHDEVVAETDPEAGSLEDFLNIMREVPSWLSGCPVEVEGWEGERYRK